jgi:voltage-gated potassium channel
VVVVAVGDLQRVHPRVRRTRLKVKGFGDAFRWSLATVTTVVYGDVVPVSSLGRAVGAVLMVSGIAILRVFISSLGVFHIKTIILKRS